MPFSDSKEYLAELALKQINELTVELDAWKETFGTSQLTHAVAKMDALRAENERLKAELEMIIAPVEADGGIVSTLRAENERLRDLLESEERHSCKLAQCWVDERKLLSAQVKRLEREKAEAVELLTDSLNETGNQLSGQRCGFWNGTGDSKCGECWHCHTDRYLSTLDAKEASDE